MCVCAGGGGGGVGFCLRVKREVPLCWPALSSAVAAPPRPTLPPSGAMGPAPSPSSTSARAGAPPHRARAVQARRWRWGASRRAAASPLPRPSAPTALLGRHATTHIPPPRAAARGDAPSPADDASATFDVLLTDLLPLDAPGVRAFTVSHPEATSLAFITWLADRRGCTWQLRGLHDTWGRRGGQGGGGWVGWRRPPPRRPPDPTPKLFPPTHRSTLVGRRRLRATSRRPSAAWPPP